MLREKWVVMVCVGACSLTVAPRLNAQFTLDELRSVVRREVAQNAVLAIPPKVDREGGDLNYDLGGAVLYHLGEDVNFNAVSQMFRAEIIRRHRNSSAQRQFWEPVLQRVESVIDQELSYRRSNQSIDQQVIDRFRLQSMRVYEGAMNEYARSLGLTARRTGTFPAKKVTIRFITNSPQTVWYIPRTRYKLLNMMRKPIDFKRSRAYQATTIQAGVYTLSLDGANPIRGDYRFDEDGDYRVN